MSSTIIRTDDRAIVLDLSTGAELRGQPIAGLGVAELSELIDAAMAAAGTSYAFGRWAEPRELYTNEMFAGTDSAEMRTIHMGVDVFCEPGTKVHAPHDGIIEYVANNDRDLDYGPMLILKHAADDGRSFFTLYGHLSMDTLDRTTAGDNVAAGTQIATVGEPPTNGNWPPHLHFQVINDLLGLGVEFPGVARKSEQDYWLGLSPSPASYFPGIEAGKLEYTACN